MAGLTQNFFVCLFCAFLYKGAPRRKFCPPFGDVEIASKAATNTRHINEMLHLSLIWQNPHHSCASRVTSQAVFKQAANLLCLLYSYSCLLSQELPANAHTIWLTWFTYKGRWPGDYHVSLMEMNFSCHGCYVCLLRLFISFSNSVSFLYCIFFLSKKCLYEF